jgi:hypothetical protein
MPQLEWVWPLAQTLANTVSPHLLASPGGVVFKRMMRSQVALQTSKAVAEFLSNAQWFAQRLALVYLRLLAQSSGERAGRN